MKISFFSPSYYPVHNCTYVCQTMRCTHIMCTSVHRIYDKHKNIKINGMNIFCARVVFISEYCLFNTNYTHLPSKFGLRNSLDLPCPKRHKKRSVAGDARWIPLAQKSPIEFSQFSFGISNMQLKISFFIKNHTNKTVGKYQIQIYLETLSTDTARAKNKSE